MKHIRNHRLKYGLQEQLVQLIYTLREKKSSELFREPVDLEKFPDYLFKIEKPIDLATILQKLKQGDYKRCYQIKDDLDLILRNCIDYNSFNTHILRRCDQFKVCINTTWKNFQRDIEARGLKYNQQLQITEEISEKIQAIEDKKGKRRNSTLQLILEEQKRSILPENPLLPPLLPDSVEEEFDPYQFEPKTFLNLTEEQKNYFLQININQKSLNENFSKLLEKKLKKYKKNIRKKINWFDQHIIRKCLTKKRYIKLQTPKHLGSLAQIIKQQSQLNIRRLQMYLKQITYWIQDNSTVLSEYMKNKFVRNSQKMIKCMIKVIKYRKLKRNSAILSASLLQDLPVIEEDMQIGTHEENEQNVRYQNRMKDFKKMLERDREISDKKDTRLVIRFQRGQLKLIDWIIEKKQIQEKSGNYRDIRSCIINRDEMLERQREEKAKQMEEERKRQQVQDDKQFLEDYKKRSNVLLISKYTGEKRSQHGRKFQIDWQQIKQRKNYITNDQFSFINESR